MRDDDAEYVFKAWVISGLKFMVYSLQDECWSCGWSDGGVNFESKLDAVGRSSPHRHHGRLACAILAPSSLSHSHTAFGTRKAIIHKSPYTESLTYISMSIDSHALSSSSPAPVLAPLSSHGAFWVWASSLQLSASPRQSSRLRTPCYTETPGHGHTQSLQYRP